MSDVRDKIIAQHIEIERPRGKTITGALEHFPTGHMLAITDDVDHDPFPLTATAAEAPAAVAALAPDEVVLTNYVETRGIPAWLAEHGYVELKNEVRIGMFGLQAVIARVL